MDAADIGAVAGAIVAGVIVAGPVADSADAALITDSEADSAVETFAAVMAAGSMAITVVGSAATAVAGFTAAPEAVSMEAVGSTAAEVRTAVEAMVADTGN